MKIIIDVFILYKEPSGNKPLYATARREVDTTLIPVAGMEIEDSAWKRPREIKRVTMDPAGNYYHLWVGNDEVDSEDAAMRQAQMYKSHDWKILGQS